MDFNEYVRLNRRFIWWCVHQNKPKDMLFEDAFQEALIVVFQALPKYDASKGGTLETYIRHMIKYRMLNLYSEGLGWLDMMEFTPERYVDPEAPCVSEALILQQTVAGLKSSVTARQWGIIQQRYISDLGLKEIAEFEGISLQRVDEILTQIKRNVGTKLSD